MFHHVFMENGSIVAWSSNEIARFLGYWRSINSEDYEMIMQKYTKLTEWNLIILILKYRNKTNNEICTIMGMNEHTLAEVPYRLKKRERRRGARCHEISLQHHPYSPRRPKPLCNTGRSARQNRPFGRLKRAVSQGKTARFAKH